MTTAHRGSDVKYHIGKEAIADRKKHQSINVIVLSDFFRYARKATYIVIRPDTPIGHAPIPPPSLSCARNTMNVVEPQITQENTWGFVSSFKIERIYGKNAINVNAIAIAL